MSGYCHTDKRVILALVAIVTCASASPGWAQRAILEPREVAQAAEPSAGWDAYVVHSGIHQGEDGGSYVPFRETIHSPGASALRVHLDDYHLDENSYITITSLEDGARQHLDSVTLPQWNGSTAYFNGDTVELELHVAPKDRNIFLQIGAIYVDSPSVRQPNSICGTTDDRVPSNDPRVGRFPGNDTPPGGGCTGWIVSNGALLTAGHCMPSSLIEFNVPASDADGTLNHPPPADQYSVDIANIDSPPVNGYDDWAVFSCFPNTETQLLPVHAQDDFFRMSRDSNPTTVRITGYGYDDSPPGSTNWNSDHKTEQTHAGDFLEEIINSGTDVRLRYLADTRPANSGSPVIVAGTDLTIGIHKAGGCNGANPEDGSNGGVGFENNDLEDAVHSFPGPVVSYADVGHVIAIEDGTVFRPFDTVTEALADVASGGIVSIVAGSYTAAAGNTFIAGADGKAMLLEAPVGSVTIGE